MSKYYETKAKKIAGEINKIYYILDTIEDIYKNCKFDKMTENEAVDIDYCMQSLRVAREWVNDARHELQIEED